MNDEFIKQVVDVIASVCGKPCALHEPVFKGRELEYVTRCIETGWVSSVGAFVDRLEHDLCELTGARFAVVTVNGTAALHTALKLVGVERDDEVIVPALSFVATANAVTYCGAIPHFADVDTSNFGLDPDLLDSYLEATVEQVDGQVRNRRTGRRIAAIVPMHTFGHPCRIDALCSLAERYDLPLVEDAAESLGSTFADRHTGTFGRLGILSFNGNKIVTAGGGGAILTDDESLARRAKHITTTAKKSHRWDYLHDEVGFNYRMPNINAALACAQIEMLPRFLEAKRALAGRYRRQFDGIDGIRFVTEPNSCHSNYWLCALELQADEQEVRDAILQATNEAGYMTRPAWTPLNRLPMYSSCPAAPLKNSDRLFQRIINIPSGSAIVLDANDTTQMSASQVASLTDKA